MSEGPEGFRLQGTAVLPRFDLPCHIEYRVVVDRHWCPSESAMTIETSEGARRISLRSDRKGGWVIDGLPAPHLKDCVDIDLGWTPATNTVPMRRLDIGIGRTANVSAAWVRFPELDVVKNEQSYTRLAPDRWRYRSGDYDFELVTDAATGLVLSYGDELWRAVAVSAG